MKIIYVTNSRIPTEKAYGLQTVSMCSAFSSFGAQVTLLAPKRKNIIQENAFEYYGIKENFEIKFIPVIDAIGIGKRFGFFLTRLSYSLSLVLSCWSICRECVVFTRDHVSGFLLRLIGFKVFYDMHGFPESNFWFWRIPMKMMSGIICTNRWKIEQCVSKFKISIEKLFLARNAFDAGIFDFEMNKENARQKTGLSNDKKIILYTGHLYDWKGVYVLARAAKDLPDFLFVFVGGTDLDVEKFKSDCFGIDNIMILGHKSHALIPFYLKSADVLVLPNSAHSKNKRFVSYSQYDTSPLKLFEYMASGTPIVASNLPSIIEILSVSNSFIFEPDNHEDLSEKILYVLKNKDDANSKSKKARSDAKNYTIENRAKDTLDFINTRI